MTDPPNSARYQQVLQATFYSGFLGVMDNIVQEFIRTKIQPFQIGCNQVVQSRLGSCGRVQAVYLMPNNSTTFVDFSLDVPMDYYVVTLPLELGATLDAFRLAPCSGTTCCYRHTEFCRGLGNQVIITDWGGWNAQPFDCQFPPCTHILCPQN